MSKQKKGKVKWTYYTERLASDFPFLIAYYFFIGHFKYLKFKNLLYLVKYPNIYSYRSEKELERFYQRIKKFKKKDFLRVAKETKSLTDELVLWLQETTLKNLKKYSNIELGKKFRKFNKLLYKFLAYFILVQYVGQALPNKDKFLGYFNKKTLHTIRVSPLLIKISKKLRVYFKIISQKLSIRQSLLFWASPSEIESLFTKRTIDAEKIEKEVEKRKKCTLFLIRKGKKYIYFGKKAKEIENKQLGGKQTQLLDVSEICGQRTGLKTKRVRGRVKIVLGKKDFKKVQQGDILVVVTTMPYYLPILKKAKGVIAEQGGLLSHTSIIGRELSLPYIIGAKMATKILKDGDLVELNTNRGVVKIIK